MRGVRGHALRWLATGACARPQGAHQDAVCHHRTPVVQYLVRARGRLQWQRAVDRCRGLPGCATLRSMRQVVTAECTLWYKCCAPGLHMCTASSGSIMHPSIRCGCASSQGPPGDTCAFGYASPHRFLCHLIAIQDGQEYCDMGCMLAPRM